MSFVIMRLPVCDRCGEPWLPRQKEIRKHPDTARTCGKCKSTFWNQNDETVIANQVPPIDFASITPSIKRKPAPYSTEKRKRPCKHGLLRCPECKTTD